MCAPFFPPPPLVKAGDSVEGPRDDGAPLFFFFFLFFSLLFLQASLRNSLGEEVGFFSFSFFFFFGAESDAAFPNPGP